MLTLDIWEALTLRVDCRAAKADAPSKKKGKEARQWDLRGGNKDVAGLDMSNATESQDQVNVAASEVCCCGLHSI